MTFSVTKLNKTSVVYDITVQTDHSFTVGDGKYVVHNCSGGYIADSINGFYSHAKEIALLTQEGFGTSGYLGDIRHRGAPISRGGTASGVMPVFKQYLTIMRDVAQGTSRRGSWAGYLPIEHGDFDEIVDYIKAFPDDANIGWNISDAFIAKLDAGDPEAHRRYKKMMMLKMLTGKGYIFKPDAVNRANPQMYKDLGLDVKASNLCFTGDTIIEIKDDETSTQYSIRLDDFIEKYEFGYYPTVFVKTYKNGEITWSKISAAAQTGVATELYEIESTSGRTIRCTGNHKIFTKNRGYVEARDLIESDELLES